VVSSGSTRRFDHKQTHAPQQRTLCSIISRDNSHQLSIECYFGVEDLGDRAVFLGLPSVSVMKRRSSGTPWPAGRTAACLTATVRKKAVLRTVPRTSEEFIWAICTSGLSFQPPKKRTVTPRRAKNRDLRTREYLSEREIDALMSAARQNRHGHRDATMILIAFRHGLRASEVADLRWDQVDFNRRKRLTKPGC